MKMRGNRPALSAYAAAQVFEDVIWIRREYCADQDFFKMTSFWDWLCDDNSVFSIKKYKSGRGDDYERRAGVIAFGDNVRLTVDEELWNRAGTGCWIANFILAHEVGHLSAGHHARSAKLKNFLLYAGQSNMCNIPPNIEEEEANMAAAFLLCGTALMDVRWESLALARRAHCDLTYVKKAQLYARLPAFQRHLNRARPSHCKGTVIL
jgi:hypothetical protein